MRVRDAVARLFWAGVLVGGVLQCLSLAGAWWSLLDLANLALPCAWALSVAGLGGLAAIGCWRTNPRLLGLSAMVMVASAVPAAAFLITSAKPAVPASERPRIRIVSFNLFKENPRFEEAIEWLAQTDADILILSELPGGLHGVPTRLAHAYPFRQSCTANGHCSTVLLSRLRPIAMQPLARGDADNRKALSAVRGSFVLNGQPFEVLGVHLSRGWDVQSQERELAMIANAITPEQRAATLVAGDFNASPLMWRMRRFGKDTGLTPASAIAATWSPTVIAPLLPLLPFDQLWMGRRWRVRRHDTGPFLGSDHRPVSIELALAKPVVPQKPNR